MTTPQILAPTNCGKYTVNPAPQNISSAMKSLRLAAGLSIKQMAEKCGVSASLIQKLESGERSNVKPISAMAIVRGSMRIPGIPEETVNSFRLAANLPAASPYEKVWRQLEDSGALRNLEIFRDFLSTLTEDEATSVVWLFDLIDSSTPTHVNRVLEHVAALSKIQLSPRYIKSRWQKPAASLVDVHSDPVRRPDGSVEKVITTYEVQDAPQNARSSNRRTRRGA